MASHMQVRMLTVTSAGSHCRGARFLSHASSSGDVQSTTCADWPGPCCLRNRRGSPGLLLCVVQHASTSGVTLGLCVRQGSRPGPHPCTSAGISKKLPAPEVCRCTHWSAGARPRPSPAGGAAAGSADPGQRLRGPATTGSLSEVCCQTWCVCKRRFRAAPEAICSPSRMSVYAACRQRPDWEAPDVRQQLWGSALHTD